jgi:putative endonuclease
MAYIISCIGYTRPMFAVYILQCADTTYYIGSTSDLERRVIEHNTSKRGAHYTKIRRPVVLRYSEQVETLSAARSREAQLKKLKREEKEKLFV